MPYTQYEESGDPEKSSGRQVPTIMFVTAILFLNIVKMFAKFADRLLLDTHHIEITCRPKR